MPGNHMTVGGFHRSVMYFHGSVDGFHRSVMYFHGTVCYSLKLDDV
jgi:hypothetical protein